MKTKCLVLAPVLLISMLLSCGGPDRTSNYIVKENTLPKLTSQTKARVVFLRPSQGGTNAADVTPVYDGDTIIGILPNDSYFVYEAEPGPHLFGSLMGNFMDFLQADIAQGKTYYVKCIRQDRFVGVHPVLQAVKKDSELMSEKDTLLSELNCTQLTDQGAESYKVQESASGNYVRYKLYWKWIKVGFEQQRDKWLVDVKESQKPLLLTEDGM